jgi:glycosyltransferase involved in cell wall biosynthesis
MKICLVSQEYPPDTAWGGIGTYTQLLARGLAARGHAVTVVSRSVTGRALGQRDGDVVVERVVPERMPLPGHRVLGRSYACLGYARAVARALAAHADADVVELPNWNAEGFWHLRRRRRPPAVVRVHSPYAEVLASRHETVTADKRLAVALERWAVRRADLVVTHSHHNARSAARAYGLDEAAIPVVPHGIPLPRAAASRPRGLPPRVLYLGRLERRKGIHVLVEALPAVLAARADVEVVVAGQDTPTAPGSRCWRDHAALTLPPEHRRRVRFVGYVEAAALEGLYDEADLVVAPSLYESFGLVYLEAMGRGRAVIGTDVSAIPEVVAAGETGLLTPPEDAPALAAAIVRLLERDDEREAMARRGRDRVERLFGDAAMVDGVVALYERAIASPGRAPASPGRRRAPASAGGQVGASPVEP